jgi:hypothetical protein
VLEMLDREGAHNGSAFKSADFRQLLAQRSRQVYLANPVILSAAKNLAGAVTLSRFFAALRMTASARFPGRARRSIKSSGYLPLPGCLGTIVSCEAASGSVRTRTDHFARGIRGWTRRSLESARCQANELTRPQGHLGPTPSELWADHRPISPEQRRSFHAAVQRHRDEIIAARNSFDPQNQNHQRQAHRQAVRQASIELGLLTTTRRSISLPLKRKKRAKIS